MGSINKASDMITVLIVDEHPSEKCSQHFQFFWNNLCDPMSLLFIPAALMDGTRWFPAQFVSHSQAFTDEKTPYGGFCVLCLLRWESRSGVLSAFGFCIWSNVFSNDVWSKHNFSNDVYTASSLKGIPYTLWK